MNDLSGTKRGRWTVLEFSHYMPGHKVMWLCRCECGTTKAVLADALTSGRSKSCGCYRKEKAGTYTTKHQMTYSKPWVAWVGMKSRCTNPNNPSYKHYGGRGIKVCDRWVSSFESFYEDMGDPPTNEHTIERLDVNGDYFPENCCWVTRKDQANNRRSQTRITAFGRTQTLAQWADEYGLKHPTLCNRLARGWPTELAISSPLGIKFRSQPRLSYRNKMITMDGRTMTLQEWSNETGLHRKTITSRIEKFGWTVGKALTTPSRKKKHP